MSNYMTKEKIAEMYGIDMKFVNSLLKSKDIVPSVICENHEWVELYKTEDVVKALELRREWQMNEDVLDMAYDFVNRMNDWGCTIVDARILNLTVKSKDKFCVVYEVITDKRKGIVIVDQDLMSEYDRKEDEMTKVFLQKGVLTFTGVSEAYN